MRRVTTTIAMILAWGVAAAQTAPAPEEPQYPRYTVEVIIFEYAEEVSVGTEQFLPDEPPLPAADDPVADERVFEDRPAEPVVGEQDPAAPEFVLHAEDELTMNDLAARLERLDVYRPVMHFAWTQPTRPEEETQPIELQALSEPPEGLDGSFMLYLSRYLHLVVDLSLEQRTGLAEPFTIDEPVTVYRDDRGGALFDELQPGPRALPDQRGPHIQERGPALLRPSEIRCAGENHPRRGSGGRRTRDRANRTIRPVSRRGTRRRCAILLRPAPARHDTTP